MDRYVWLVHGSKAAKVAWLKDARSGVYFSARDPNVSSKHHFPTIPKAIDTLRLATATTLEKRSSLRLTSLSELQTWEVLA